MPPQRPTERPTSSRHRSGVAALAVVTAITGAALTPAHAATTRGGEAGVRTLLAQDPVATAVVTGRVTDENGDPIRWVQVTFFTETGEGTWEQLPDNPSAQTGLEGQYLQRLVPGRYKVRVLGVEGLRETAFHGGGSTVGEAVVLTVTGSRSGVDVVLPFAASVTPLEVIESPVLAGRAVVGSTLTASWAEYDAGHSHHSVWLRDGVEIPGTTYSRTYDLTAADLGHRVTYRERAWNSRRRAVTVESPASAVVARGTFAAHEVAIPPRIDGEARVGRVLRAIRGSRPYDSTYAWEWVVGGRAVPGATGVRFRLRPRHLGKRVRLRATVSKPGYHSVRRASLRTGPVAERPRLTR